MKMKDQVIVITGASGGIGKVITERFEQDGAQLALLDLSFKSLIESDKEKFSKALLIECDISNKKDVENAKDKILTSFGKVDVLVNSAGILPSITPLEEIEEEKWTKTIDINLKGTFFCTQIFGKVMLDHHGGVIVNIASMAGLTASPKRGAYSTSKAAVLMLTQQTALEWGSRNIRANAICPGYIETPMISHMYRDHEVRKKRESLIPSGRLGTPEEVAKIVHFLASLDAEYINGEFIKVDGGYTLTTLPNIDLSGNVI